MRHPGPVISNNRSTELPVPVKHSSKAVHLNQVKFLDGKLKSVRTGFPLGFDSDTCVQCLKDSPDSIIIASNCTVSPGPTFSAGSLSLDVEIFPNGSIGRSFSEIGDGHRLFLGKCGTTFNGSHSATFIVHGNIREIDNTAQLFYIEYANQAHFEKIRAKITENVGKYLKRKVNLSFPIQSTIRVEIIHCVENQLYMEAFREAVQVYRTMQLDSFFEPLPFHDNCNCFESIKEGDIYSAVLALKLADGTEIDGEYLVYSHCAIYNPMFLIPFIVSSLTFMILLTVAHVQWKTNSVNNEMGDFHSIPHTAEGWFRYVCGGNNLETRKVELNFSALLNIIDLGSDEMLLVGEDDDLHVEWRSKGEHHRRNVKTAEEERSDSGILDRKIIPLQPLGDNCLESMPKTQRKQNQLE